MTKNDDVEETIKFVSYFDKFFDSLNVANLHVGKHKRKPFQLPYTSSSDTRLTVGKAEYTLQL